jgi:hypothetical protein
MMCLLPGYGLDPRFGCECVHQSVIDALYDHGLNDQCQATCTGTGCGGSGSGSGSIDVDVDVDGTITIGGGGSGSGGNGGVTISTCPGEGLPGGQFWSWEACACFTGAVWCDIACIPGTIQNPLAGSACGDCLSQAEYDAIFDHGLGENCLGSCTGSSCGGGSGSGSIGVDVDIDHDVDITIGGGSGNSWGNCAEGYYWDMDACTCFAEIQCTLMCAPGFDLDPREGCSCVPLIIVNAIYNHGLDENC